MAMQPLVSILIPVYNREKVISETLDSLIAQSFQNWECVLVDDGSTDYTLHIVEEYVKKDERFKCFKRPDNRKPGGCGARNYAFEQSQGQYIKWLDSDDLLEPLLLEKEVETFQQFPDVDFVYCDHQTFNEANKPNQTTIFNNNFSSGIELLNQLSTSRKYILLGTYSLKRSIINTAGLWNETLKINQDGEFLFRLLTKCNKTKSISYIGFNYRIGGNNSITSNSDVDRDKIRNKLKSWVLIDQQVQLNFNPSLLPYINGYKEFLYKYYLHLHQYDSIIEFKDFFKDQIKNEERKRIKFQLLKTYFKSFLY